MSVRVETTDRAITAFGGAELLREAARAVGLAGELEKCLRLKKRARGLSDTQFVMGMAESVALGARCLDDLVVNRSDDAQAQLRGFDVPAPQTAGTWLRRFSLGHVRQLGKAMAAAQRNAYVAHLWGEGGDVGFRFGLRVLPFPASPGSGPHLQEGVRAAPTVVFRRPDWCGGGRPAAPGKVVRVTGISTFVTEALRAVPQGVGVRARFDSSFCSGPLFAQLDAAGVTYLCGAPLTSPLIEAASQIADEYWVSCADKEGQVAEFGYRMRTGGFRRYVVKRVEIPPGRQASLWEGGYRYWIFVTNDHHADPASLELQHRQKVNVETGMAELKSNFGLHAFRKHGFMANWAWLLIVCLGHNLCAWTQHPGALCAGRDDGELRAKRLRYRYLNIPAMVVRSGRRMLLKLRCDYRFLSRFLAALRRLRAIRPAPA